MIGRQKLLKPRVIRVGNHDLANSILVKYNFARNNFLGLFSLVFRKDAAGQGNNTEFCKFIANIQLQISLLQDKEVLPPTFAYLNVLTKMEKNIQQSPVSINGPALYASHHNYVHLLKNEMVLNRADYVLNSIVNRFAKAVQPIQTNLQVMERIYTKYMPGSIIWQANTEPAAGLVTDARKLADSRVAGYAGVDQGKRMLHLINTINRKELLTRLYLAEQQLFPERVVNKVQLPGLPSGQLPVQNNELVTKVVNRFFDTIRPILMAQDRVERVYTKHVGGNQEFIAAALEKVYETVYRQRAGVSPTGPVLPRIAAVLISAPVVRQLASSALQQEPVSLDEAEKFKLHENIDHVGEIRHRELQKKALVKMGITRDVTGTVTEKTRKRPIKTMQATKSGGTVRKGESPDLKHIPREGLNDWQKELVVQELLKRGLIGEQEAKNELTADADTIQIAYNEVRRVIDEHKTELLSQRIREIIEETKIVLGRTLEHNVTSEVKQVVERTTRQALEEELRQAVETVAKYTLKHEVAQTTETTVKQTWETEIKRAVETIARYALENEAKQAVETTARQTLENEVKQSVETTARHTLENEVKQAVETTARQTLENEVTQFVETTARHTLENEVKQAVETTARHILENEVRQAVETIAKYTLATEEKKQDNEMSVRTSLVDEIRRLAETRRNTFFPEQSGGVKLTSVSFGVGPVVGHLMANRMGAKPISLIHTLKELLATEHAGSGKEILAPGALRPLQRFARMLKVIRLNELFEQVFVGSKAPDTGKNHLSRIHRNEYLTNRLLNRMIDLYSPILAAQDNVRNIYGKLQLGGRALVHRQGIFYDFVRQSMSKEMGQRIFEIVSLQDNAGVNAERQPIVELVSTKLNNLLNHRFQEQISKADIARIAVTQKDITENNLSRERVHREMSREVSNEIRKEVRREVSKELTWGEVRGVTGDENRAMSREMTLNGMRAEAQAITQARRTWVERAQDEQLGIDSPAGFALVTRDYITNRILKRFIEAVQPVQALQRKVENIYTKYFVVSRTSLSKTVGKLISQIIETSKKDAHSQALKLSVQPGLMEPSWNRRNQERILSVLKLRASVGREITSAFYKGVHDKGAHDKGLPSQRGSSLLLKELEKQILLGERTVEVVEQRIQKYFASAIQSKYAQVINEIKFNEILEQVYLSGETSQYPVDSETKQFSPVKEIRKLLADRETNWLMSDGQINRFSAGRLARGRNRDLTEFVDKQLNAKVSKFANRILLTEQPGLLQRKLNSFQTNLHAKADNAVTHQRVKGAGEAPKDLVYTGQPQLVFSTPSHETSTASKAAAQTDTEPVKEITKEIEVQRVEVPGQQMPQINISKLADKVFRELEKKLKFERQRRGLY